MSRKIEGKVIKKSDKTAMIEYPVIIKNNKYLKSFRVTRKVMVHDDKNITSVGDQVEISQTRPVSRNKSWKISKILK